MASICVLDMVLHLCTSVGANPFALAKASKNCLLLSIPFQYPLGLCVRKNFLTGATCDWYLVRFYKKKEESAIYQWLRVSFLSNYWPHRPIRYPFEYDRVAVTWAYSSPSEILGVWSLQCPLAWGYPFSQTLRCRAHQQMLLRLACEGGWWVKGWNLTNTYSWHSHWWVPTLRITLASPSLNFYKQMLW